MIVTVTLNLALDVTYEVAEVAWHRANRVSAVAQRAGGKGVNVARVLDAIGHDVVVTGPVGGPTGDAVRTDLAATGIVDALVPIAGETRRTLAVVDDAQGDATVAALTAGLVAGRSWPERLAEAAALSAAAVGARLAGSFDEETYRSHLGAVRVETVTGSPSPT